MIRIALWTLLVVALFSLTASSSQAAQYSNGRGNVVHSRRAPVVMHRTFPPYTGIHVYQGGRRAR